MKDAVIEVNGTIKSWQTELDTGVIVPGTKQINHNTIGSDLKKYLAHVMAVTTDESIKEADLQTSITFVYEAGKSGIAFVLSGASYQSEWFITEINDGGDGIEAYVEFYGYIDGAVTLNGTLQLGSVLTGGASTAVYTNTFATYTINETVPAARRFHFYWKVTMS